MLATFVMPLLLAGPMAPAQQDPLPPLVSTRWLAEHLGDADLVILHVGDDRSKPVYDAGHIPGAQFLHPWNELAAPREEGALNLELPSLDRLKATLEAKGISAGSRVVVYSASQYFTPTTRSLFTLEYAGLRGRVAILDGGLEAWTAENRPLTTAIPSVVASAFTPRTLPDLVVEAEFVASNLENPKVAVIDARDPRFYEGAETRQGRNGHIKGARNIPFSSIVTESGHFKDAATLRGMFEAAGAEPGDRVVTYCHIGQQATLVWFAARLAGYDAVLYDGSFQDWARRTELPVVTPAVPPPGV